MWEDVKMMMNVFEDDEGEREREKGRFRMKEV